MSFPGTLVFLVLLNRVNPMLLRIRASISSSSVSTSISISSLDRLGLGNSGVPFARGLGSLRSPLRSCLGARGGVLDLSLAPFRMGERERSRYRSPLDGGPAWVNQKARRKPVETI